MHGVGSKDGEREIRWSDAAGDYVRFRSGPPASWYRVLAAHGIGVRGQRLLDLGTGPGFVALHYARGGLAVAGIDPDAGQIAAARAAAETEGLAVDFRVAPAEELPFGPGAFEVATAAQCLLYFDAPRVVEELRRVLVAGGLFVTGHLSWLAREDEVARRTEELILAHNPDWSAGDWSGVVPVRPDWAQGLVEWRGCAVWDEHVPFTHASWRGRMRACRGIGAELGAAAVAAFDRELQALLETLVPQEFSVRHRVDAHWFAV